MAIHNSLDRRLSRTSIFVTYFESGRGHTPVVTGAGDADVAGPVEAAEPVIAGDIMYGRYVPQAPERGGSQKKDEASAKLSHGVRVPMKAPG